MALGTLIVGIVTGRNAQLSSVSAQTVTKDKDKSTEMRLRHLVKHISIDMWIYLPFAKQILEALSALPLRLVMDRSQVGRGCMVLIVVSSNTYLYAGLSTGQESPYNSSVSHPGAYQSFAAHPC